MIIEPLSTKNIIYLFIYLKILKIKMEKMNDILNVKNEVRFLIRTLRTFLVFRAANELDTGEQRYAAGQQHCEAAQIHVPLAASVSGGCVPSTVIN